MHPELIKAALRMRGLTLADVGDAEGVSKQSIAMAIKARFSERCERAVAKALDKLPHEIWPTRYHANGSRIEFRKRARGNESRAAA